MSIVLNLPFATKYMATKKDGNTMKIIQSPQQRPYVLAAEAMGKVKADGGTAEQQVKAFEVTLAHFMDPANLDEFDQRVEWETLMTKYNKKPKDKDKTADA